MSRFRVEEKTFGKLPSVKIIDDVKGSSIEIGQMGATLLSFIVRTNRGLLNIVDGFQSYEEMISSNTPRSWIMAPFYGRMVNNSYTVKDKNYDVSKLDSKKALFGLIGNEEFQVASLSVEDEFVELILTCDKLVKAKLDVYPFKVLITVKYLFTGNKLRVEISGKNTGRTKIPFACSWHPYFKLSETGIDSLVLGIPAERLILTDSNYIPYANEMTYSSLSNLPGSDFRPVIYQKKRMLGKRMLNACYARLTKGTNNLVETKIENTDYGTSITVRQERGVLFCSTGDETQERFRQSIAIQPAEFIGNVFNRTDFKDEIVLSAGEERTFPIEVEFFQI